MKTVIIINIFTSVVVFVAGVLILLMPVSQNSSATVVFGIIMIAYAVYRFMNVLSKQRILKQEEKIEKLKLAQEEIIKNARKQDENEHK